MISTRADERRGLRVVLLGGMAASAQELLGELSTTPLAVSAHPVYESEGAASALVEAEVVVTPKLTREMIANAERLRLVHGTGAGVDRIDLAALPEAVRVCNCHGHSQAMAEYVLGAMVVLTRRLLLADRLLREGNWSFGASFGPPRGGELHSSRIVIVGAGEAVSALVPITIALGMDVTIVTRRPRLVADRFEGSVHAAGFDALAALLPNLDYLVLAVPLTDLTRNLIGRKELESMKPSAILVNVARAAVVDEPALFDALRLDRIGGAAVDVWNRFPTVATERLSPSELPFHELENVLITPHFAGWSSVSRLNRWRTIADNIDRWAAGRPLTNVVHGEPRD